jgi:hypothetical protein
LKRRLGLGEPGDRRLFSGEILRGLFVDAADFRRPGTFDHRDPLFGLVEHLAKSGAGRALAGERRGRCFSRRCRCAASSARAASIDDRATSS